MSMLGNFRELVESLWNEEAEEAEEHVYVPAVAEAPVARAPSYGGNHNIGYSAAHPGKFAGGTVYGGRPSFVEAAEEEGSVVASRASSFSTTSSVDEPSVTESFHGHSLKVQPPPKKESFASPVQVAGGTTYGKRLVVQPETKFHTPQLPNAGSFQAPVLYQARQGDPLDEAVEKFFQQKPHVFKPQAGLTRLGPGRYSIYGREVRFELAIVGAKGKLYVKDGPLTQPLDGYLENKDASAEYNDSVMVTRNGGAILTIPEDCRMTFYDTGAGYSRLDAMKVAKEQAIVREKAAVRANNGDVQTGDLRSKYVKTIDAKLGKNHAAGASAWPQ